MVVDPKDRQAGAIGGREDVARAADPGVTQSTLGAHVAQLVEHILGKDEVTGSSPVMGSMFSQLI